jgi:crossover junction endodeoxyribonuclease RusA
MSEPLKLTFPVPPSANRYWRTVVAKGRAMTFVSTEAKQYKKDVSTLAKVAGIRRLLQSELAVTVRFYRAQRSGDLDNRLKCLLDAMQNAIYISDSQIVEIHAFRHDDKYQPRVEVEITEIGQEQELFSEQKTAEEIPFS